MGGREDREELDALIDRAVDTFFVEAPTEEETLAATQFPLLGAPTASGKPEAAQTPAGPSLDEAVSTLFTSTFKEEQRPSLRAATLVTSGDRDTDDEIDLAVDTLFVEEPETPPPETAEVRVTESSEEEERVGEYLGIRGGAERKEKRQTEVKPPSTLFEAAVAGRPASPSYDEAMALEIERHMHTLYQESPREPSQPAGKKRSKDLPEPAQKRSAVDMAAVRKLQEAILTLEWEISSASVTALANELHRVRRHHKDFVAVDFAGLAMRVVLDYIVKRMSRAHPESIRFLLETADLLERCLAAPEEDPLRWFHRILVQYEDYKSVVRKAEGIPDRKPSISGDLELRNPASFARSVEIQAMTVARAGESLVARLATARDPENLIRSFRFLVTRAMNRILEDTVKTTAKGAPKK